MQHAEITTTLPDQEERMPAITKIMLAPIKSIYNATTESTKGNFKQLATVLGFTVTISGFLLGASIATFGFANSPFAYMVAVPLSMGLYYLIDKLVVMSDNRKSAGFIKKSRYVIAIALSLLNSMLVDSIWYSDDIRAAQIQKITLNQNKIQSKADSVADVHRAHKDILYGQIHEADQQLQSLNTALTTEAEGAGYSHQVGMGAVYQAKKAALDLQRSENISTKALMLAEAAKDDSAIAEIQRTAAVQKKHVPIEQSKGINESMELLHHAIMKSPITILVAVLCLFIAMIFELLPLLAKTYLDISEYFIIAEHEKEQNIAQAALRSEHAIQLAAHQQTLAHERAQASERDTHILSASQQEMQHRESLLTNSDAHFQNILTKESEMQERYPNHFADHVKPLIDDVYRQFREQSANLYSSSN